MQVPVCNRVLCGGDAVLVARFGELAFSPDLDLVYRAVAVSLCLLPAVPLLLTGSLYQTDSGRD